MKDLIERFQTFLMMLVLLAVAALISSCCSDCPTGPVDPKPYKGWLYANDGSHTVGVIYQIDTETDSVVDSIIHEGPDIWTPLSMDISSSGKYLAVNYASLTPGVKKLRIFDAQTLDLINELDGGMQPLFVEEANLLLGFGDGIKFYSLPDFSQIGNDPIGRTRHPILFKEDGLLYIESALRPESSDSEFLIVYNYIKMEAEDTLIITDSLGNWFSLFNFDINISQDRLYFMGFTDAVPSALNCYDLVNREFLFRKSFYSVYGDLVLSPSEDEFYVDDPGYPTSLYSPGTVFIYDAENCDYIGGISLFGYLSGGYSDLPLYAKDIIFTPDGGKAYVGTGDLMRADGCIVVIDAYKQQVTDLIWPEMKHNIVDLAMGPKR